jgi:aspartate aminotransferase-like enzyme
MNERRLVMATGPTIVDPKILRALSKPTVSSMDPDFGEIFKKALED